MDYIKTSFRKTFLPVLIYHSAIFLLNIILEKVDSSFLFYWYINNGDVSNLLMNPDNYHLVYFMYADYLGVTYALIVAVLTSPVQIGLYRYCFERLNDEYTSAGWVFDFYKGPKKILGSVAAKNLVSVAMCIIVALLVMILGTKTGGFPILNTFTKIVTWLVSMAVLLFLFLTEYRYAAYSEDGLKSAVLYAFEAARKNWLKIVPVILVLAFINVLLAGGLMKLAVHAGFIGKCGFILDALTMWIGITFAHSIFEDDMTW